MWCPRTIHHRFLIMRNPSNLAMHLCLWCKDKSTWRQPVVYIVETGVTVFEVINKLIKTDC